MIIKYAIALAVVLLLAAIVRLGVPAAPLPARQPGPAPADPAAPAAAPRQGLRPRLQPVAALGPPGRPAPLRPDPRRAPAVVPDRRTRASTRSSSAGPTTGTGLRVPLEEHLLVMAPPRTYKTAFLADVILSYPGPVIATSTKPDLYALTSRRARPARPGARVQPAAHRRRRLHVLLVPGRADARTRPPPSAAPTRSRSPSRPRASRTPRSGPPKPRDYLRGYFHAAALARYDLRTVAAWVSGADPDVPERILLAAGARQWALTLAELRSEAHKTAATVRMVMSRALAFMADPALAASVLPAPGRRVRHPRLPRRPRHRVPDRRSRLRRSPGRPAVRRDGRRDPLRRRPARPGVRRPGGWIRRC